MISQRRYASGIIRPLSACFTGRKSSCPILALMVSPACLSTTASPCSLAIGSCCAAICRAPLAERVYAQMLAAGGNPTVLWNDETLDESFYAAASDDQLRWISPVEELLAERVDARIVIRAPENTRSLTGVDPARQRLHGVAQQPLRQRYQQRAASRHAPLDADELTPAPPWRKRPT